MLVCSLIARLAHHILSAFAKHVDLVHDVTHTDFAGYKTEAHTIFNKHDQKSNKKLLSLFLLSFLFVWLVGWFLFACLCVCERERESVCLFVCLFVSFNKYQLKFLSIGLLMLFLLRIPLD